MGPEQQGAHGTRGDAQALEQIERGAGGIRHHGLDGIGVTDGHDGLARVGGGKVDHGLP
jgi:hypothetical protein